MSTPATVTQASPLLVTLDGSDTAVPSLRLASYTPALGDRVAVICQGSGLIALGKVI